MGQKNGNRIPKSTQALGTFQFCRILIQKIRIPQNIGKSWIGTKIWIANQNLLVGAPILAKPGLCKSKRSICTTASKSKSCKTVGLGVVQDKASSLARLLGLLGRSKKCMTTKGYHTTTTIGWERNQFYLILIHLIDDCNCKDQKSNFINSFIAVAVVDACMWPPFWH